MNRIALKQFAVRARLLLLHEIRPLTDSDETAERFAQLWFMRLTALRYMEVNDCMPCSMPETISALQELCQRLAGTPALAGLFGEPLPFPEVLLAKNGMLAEMLAQISVSEWLGFPEILGWLYQYYNTDGKERILKKLQNRGKIAPEEIPAATQTFTPDWIVRYMTQNVLSAFRTPDQGWQYRIPEAEQPSSAQQKCRALEKIRQDITLESLTVIDPCMGTGHILSYVFDALMDLYRAEGDTPETAAAKILEHNIFGLDIDENACALASFVLLMKARQFDADILQKNIRLHLYHFTGLELPEDGIPPEYSDFAAQFRNAATFGSLLCPEEIPDIPSNSPETLVRMHTIARVLTQQYDAVITNPPYMGSSSMDAELAALIRRHYPDSKSDLFAAFMERCAALTAPHGCFAMITQHAWMFLSSYEKLRRKMQAYTMRNMVHLGARAFSSTDVGTIVQTTAFVCLGSYVPDYRSTYLRLAEDEDKERAFFAGDNRYICDIGRFSGIAGEPLCYWISDRMRRVLQGQKLSEICRICQGMTTSDNKRFLRLWHEVTPGEIAFGCQDAKQAMDSGKRWFPYNKGGKFRKWYGNTSHVVDFYRNGEEMRAFHAELNKMHSGGRIKNEKMFFLPAVTWPFITESVRFGVRYQPEGFLFDVSGSSLFPDPSQCFYLMGFLSSKVALEILKLSNPTMNFQVENISSLPIIFEESHKPEIERLVVQNIALAREEWDSYEQSWDFRCHPLVQKGVTRIADAYRKWERRCRRRIRTMQANEQRLNAIFIEIYGLEGEISPEVRTEEITLRPADRQTDVRSLLSFAVGCMFGRYHVGHADFLPVSRNFIPVSEGHREDAVYYLEQFLTAVYGAETLEENLQFLAESIGGMGTSREVLRRYFGADFYYDHCLICRRRPIYWMADSGRRRAFRGLWYLHRMDADALAAAQASAVLQRDLLAEEVRKSARLSRKKALMEEKISEISAFLLRLQTLQESGVQVIPDDGVLRNYERFRKVLSKIR